MDTINGKPALESEYAQALKEFDYFYPELNRADLSYQRGSPPLAILSGRIVTGERWCSVP